MCKKAKSNLQIFERKNVNDKSDLNVIFCLLYWSL